MFKHWNPEYLKKAPPEDVKAVFGLNVHQRALHRTTTRGYTKDKTFRKIASIPAKIFHHPEFSKYFDPNMDTHELGKNIDRFLRLFPECKVVDKL